MPEDREPYADGTSGGAFSKPADYRSSVEDDKARQEAREADTDDKKADGDRSRRG